MVKGRKNNLTGKQFLWNEPMLYDNSLLFTDESMSLVWSGQSNVKLCGQ